jgi:WbqC-like protein
MGKTIAIVQSNYIPWKGYFDLIRAVDEFILYDDAQYTRRDWRNRNKVKTPTGPQWLTIPVEVKGKYYQAIKDVQISDTAWTKAHWKTIVHNYARGRSFREYCAALEDLYLGTTERYLSEINYRFLTVISRMLGIKTKVSWSMDYHRAEGKTERLVDLCKQAGATEYLSGPSAKGYIDEALFQAEGIALRYVDYAGYPEYAQLYPPFEHTVSVIDLILNTGSDAPKYLKSL